MKLYKIFILALAVMLPSISLSVDEPTKDVPKTKEERLRELQLERAELTLKQMKASKEEKENDYNSMKTLFDQKLVTIQELNMAKKDMDDAQLAYDQAKFDLQMEELKSLRAAWHITISEAKVIDKGDRKEMMITLENTSERVKLERTKKMIEQKIIEPVDIEVNPEINDVYVSIKEGDNIISKPYERYIKSLKVGVPQTLTFELIKDVEDVVVSIRYEDQEDRRNIHLKKIEPYISVVKAVKYKTDSDERMLYVVLKNGAVEKEGEELKSGSGKTTITVKPKASNSDESTIDASLLKVLFSVGLEFQNALDNSKISPQLRQKFENNNRPLSDKATVSVETAGRDWTIADSQQTYRITKENGKLNVYISDYSGAENDINNIYVSVKDEQMNIIGVPYEIKIPVLKYNEQKIYRFKLQKNVNSVVVSMNYLKKENNKTIYLEPDTRHISILSAQVYKLTTGKKEVMLELVNRSESGETPFADEISGGSAMATSELRNVFVSLKNKGIVIARPYEAVIPRMEYNKPIRLRFELQQPEVEDVTVLLSYLDKTDERSVYLEKVSPEDVVTVNSIGFAQEGMLGRSVSYDLTLERLAESERIFKLRVINLPEQFTYQFNDTEGGTRVTQIKFTQAQSKRNLSLQVFLPEKMDMKLLNEPLEFYAAVLSEEKDTRYEPGRMTLNQGELTRLGGKVGLILTPKGVPEFELIAQNLYFEIKPGETVDMQLTLKNTGTRNLSDIRITTDLPSNKWSSDIQPSLVSKLDRDAEKDIKVKIIPASDVGVGDTEVKIKAVCEVDNVKIEAPEKNVRIHISGRTNITGTVILISALILLIVGIAVLTIKLSRR
jgi:hypothetical protein